MITQILTILLLISWSICLHLNYKIEDIRHLYHYKYDSKIPRKYLINFKIFAIVAVISFILLMIDMLINYKIFIK